jgi:hypothetical protein
MQVQALEVRVFVNQPKATARTKTIGNPAYAGAFGFIGHGGTEHDVEAAHCAACAALGHDHDHAFHAGHEHAAPTGHDHGAPAGHVGHDHGVVAGGERFDVEFDLSAALRAVESERDEVTLKLIAVDIDGNDVAADDVLIDEIELVVD